MTTEQAIQNQNGQTSAEDAQQAAANAVAAEDQQQSAEGQQAGQEGQQQQSQEQTPDFLDAVANFVSRQDSEEAMAAAQQQQAQAQTMQMMRLMGKLGQDVESLKAQLASGEESAEPTTPELQAIQDLINDPELDEANRAILQRNYDAKLAARQAAVANKPVDPQEVARLAAEETARRMMPQPTEWTTEEQIGVIEYGKGIAEAIGLDVNLNNRNLQEALVSNVPLHYTAEQAKPILRQNLQGLKAKLDTDNAGGNQNGQAAGLESAENPMNGRVPPSSTNVPGDNTASPTSDEEVMSAFMDKSATIPSTDFYDALSKSDTAKMRELIAKY